MSKALRLRKLEGELREKLAEPFAQRKKAGMIVSDNDTELTSNKVLG